MGKYKQWLHHQEVGARLRDEIAAHEAERERVLKLAPPKETPLPDISNPVIAALLGQAALTKASEASAARAGRNGGSTTGVPTTGGIGQASATQAASGITGRPVPQASKPEAPTQ
jgi:hypothetical protein